MAELTTEQAAVFQLIDEQELVELAVAMGNIKAPSGYEQPMADFVLQWLKANGFENAYQQQLSEGRSNTIGILRGTGAGKSLIFNSHMDSEHGMPMRLDEEPSPDPTASVDQDKQRIFGVAVQNDRGPMAGLHDRDKSHQEQRHSFGRRSPHDDGGR